MNAIEIVTQIRLGNLTAIEELIAAYRDRLLRYAYCATGNWRESEDVVRQTFMNAWEQIATLNDPARLTPWLFHRMIDLCCNPAHKRKPSWIDLTASPHELRQAKTASSPAPENRSVLREVGATLQALIDPALAAMPALSKHAFLLYHYERFPIETVAATLNIPTATARAHLAAAQDSVTHALLCPVGGESLPQLEPETIIQNYCEARHVVDIPASIHTAFIPGTMDRIRNMIATQAFTKILYFGLVISAVGTGLYLLFALIGHVRY